MALQCPTCEWILRDDGSCRNTWCPDPPTPRPALLVADHGGDSETTYELDGNSATKGLPAGKKVDKPAKASEDAPSLHSESAAFAGLAGDVVRLLSPYTEADPAGLLGCTLTMFGAMVGDRAEVQIGQSSHPPMLFFAQVGRSAKSRKDTGRVEVGGVFRRVEEDWHKLYQLGGFNSAEAHIEHAAENAEAPILVVESELSRVLAAAGRDGSQVSSQLRQWWDFTTMANRTKGKALVAPPTAGGFIGNITQRELRDKRVGLRPVDISNGFGNRFIWFYVDARQVIPLPTAPPTEAVNPLVRNLRAVLEAARSAGGVEMTPDGEEFWRDEIYPLLRRDDSEVAVVDDLCSRAPAQVRRLSLIYTLLDGSGKVEPPHLRSAFEVWRYCRWSIQHIWAGEGTGDPDVDRIANVLSGGTDLDGVALDRMFAGHKDTEELRRKAVTAGIAVIVSDTSTGGRPRTVLRGTRGISGLADKPPPFSASPLSPQRSAQWWRTPTYRRPEVEE